MPNCVLTFDVESTGLPKTKGFNNYYDYKELKYYDNSRIVSIAWNLLYKKKLISSKYFIIKPKDFKVDENSISYKINKISRKMTKKGTKLDLIL